MTHGFILVEFAEFANLGVRNIANTQIPEHHFGILLFQPKRPNVKTLRKPVTCSFNP